MADVSDTRYHGNEYYDDPRDPREARERERAIREDERVRSRESRATTVRLATAIISVISGLFAAILALHIAFVIFDANSANPLVLFVSDFARGLVLFFHDLFTPQYEWLRVLLNYGLAALFWLGVGRGLVVLVRSLR